MPAISADGRYVAFGSLASNLVAGDTNRASDGFVRDRRSGRTERVSVAGDGTQANNDVGRDAFVNGAPALCPDVGCADPVGQLRERIRDIVTVSADEGLHRAVELMATHGIGDLIAVQPETGFSVGVVSALGLTAVAASSPR